MDEYEFFRLSPAHRIGSHMITKTHTHIYIYISTRISPLDNMGWPLSYVVRM